MCNKNQYKRSLRRCIATIIISIIETIIFAVFGIVLMYQYDFGYAIYSFILSLLWAILLGWWIQELKVLKMVHFPIFNFPYNAKVQVLTQEELEKLLFGIELQEKKETDQKEVFEELNDNK